MYCLLQKHFYVFLLHIYQEWLQLCEPHDKLCCEHHWFYWGKAKSTACIWNWKVCSTTRHLQLHEVPWQKLFKPKYAPEPFCYTICQLSHCPDVTLSKTLNGEVIETLNWTFDRPIDMNLPIKATWLSFMAFRSGGHICYSEKVELVAWARQFRVCYWSKERSQDPIL